MKTQQPWRVGVLVGLMAAAAVLAWGGGAARAAEAPRVAVWDPVADLEGGRFPVSTAYLNEVSKWLREGGVTVERLTADQVADPAKFGADRFDALMLEGDVIPGNDIQSYNRFMKAGGVLIALASENPFHNRIAQNAQGQWRLAPENPNFAWQTEDVTNPLGVQFKWIMDMAYTGVKHSATSLLEAYLPQAKGWSLEKALPARWYVSNGGTFYPLIRSRQVAGGDYTPQLYLVANGSSRAIVCAGKIFTGTADSQVWPWGRETVAALARLAKDLHDGKVTPGPQQAVSLPAEVVLPGPLEIRSAAAGINPERAVPVVRWGRFDGSRLDLGKTLGAGLRTQLSAGVKDDQVPGELAPGATMELGLPDLGDGVLSLRVRGAFARSGAALTVRLGDIVLLNEQFIYRLSEGVVNISFAYNGAPNEFTRVRVLPPAAGAARTLVLSNPGTQPLYFDAIQIERRSEPARAMGLGLGNGVGLAYGQPTKLTPEICKDWSYFRCCCRPWWIGPPEDPQRWELYDRHMGKLLALSAHVQVQLEGTPEWAPITPQRYQSAGKQRPMMTPPDNAKYREIVRRVATKYAGRVDGWEIWNEQNHTTFWMGTKQEFSAFFNAIVPVIRECDPKANVIIGGLAGTTSGYVDQDAAEMVRAGCTRQADLFGFHPYARNGAWDLPYGLFEGHLMNLGSDIEIYCNESGYSLKAEGGEPGSTLASQAANLNQAMGRLLACGLAKLTIFNAGGDGDPFGLLDKNAQPRPAYAVFSDYLALARRGGRRLDAGLFRADGRPVEGVYVAAATHDDGAVTLVVNPADVETMTPPEDPSHDFAGKNNGGWVCFTGKPQYAADKVTLTPGEKGYAGFFRKIVLDPQVFPTLAVKVPDCAGNWSLTLKFADGENVILADKLAAGEFTFPYLDKLKNREKRECEISFRIFTGAASLAYVRFSAAATTRPAPDAISVRLAVPLPRAGGYTAVAQTGGAVVPVSLKEFPARGQNWAQVDLALTGRTVVTLTPVGSP